MAMKIFLKHKNKNKVKTSVLGFSWTTFFFGLFVPLFRKDFKMFLPFFLIYMSLFYFAPYNYSMIDGMISFEILDDSGIYSKLSTIFYFMVNILGAFFYNKLYTQGLVNKGFYPISGEGTAILQAYGIKLPLEIFEDLEQE